MDRLSAPITAAVAYDLIADLYDKWHWTDFWERNEVPLVSETIKSLPPGNFLDLGCGTGRYRAVVEQYHPKYTGLDVSEQMLLINSRNHPHSHSTSELILGDLRNTALPANSYDAILVSRVLSHTDDLNSALREINRLLKSGGHLLITDVHSEHPYNTTAITMFGTQINIETFKWTRDDLLHALKSQNLKIIQFKDFTNEDLLYKPSEHKFGKLFRHSCTKVFYLLHAQKI